MSPDLDTDTTQQTKPEQLIAEIHHLRAEIQLKQSRGEDTLELEEELGARLQEHVILRCQTIKAESPPAKLEAEKKASLTEMRRIGPEKPMGFLPTLTLEILYEVDPEALKKELEGKGLKTLIINPDPQRPHTIGGALYAYDEQALGLLLEENKAILEEAGWPTETEAFVRQVESVTAPSGTKLFDLIADAFDDKTNLGRSDLGAPTRIFLHVKNRLRRALGNN